MGWGEMAIIIFFGLFIILIIFLAISGYKKEREHAKYQEFLDSHWDKCLDLSSKIAGSLTKEIKVEIIETDSKHELEQRLEQLKKLNNNSHNIYDQVIKVNSEYELERKIEQLKKWSKTSHDRYNNISNLKTQLDFNKQKHDKYFCFAEYDLLVLKEGVTKHEYNKLVKEHNEIAEQYNDLISKNVFSIPLIVYI